MLLIVFTTLIVAVASTKTYNTPIKHVVVLMEENRSFDHLFGFSSIKGLNKLTGSESNPVDLNDPSKGLKTVDDQSPWIGECDPCHGLPCTTYKLYGGTDTSKEPSMNGFADYQKNSEDKDFCGVMSMFSEENVPIISTLAKEYAIMDRFFASIPGPTFPNRLMCLSGTTGGDTATTVYKNGFPHLYSQKTIFDSFEEAGHDWSLYFHDLPWEVILDRLLLPKNLGKIHRMHRFYDDVEKGSLPAFSWINPRTFINITTGEGSNDQHPDHDVRLGEALIKQVYEALRAGPKWNETLFIVTYDEHGGFYDHVAPPSKGIPAPDDSKSYPDEFDFQRLGLRIPTLLISPWIERGKIISAPSSSQKPTNTSEFDLTSIPATMKHMFGLNDFLTKRDTWAASFDDVFSELEKPRDDCIEKLPEVPTRLDAESASWEANRPLNHLQQDYLNVISKLNGVSSDHITLQGHGGEWVSAQVDRILRGEGLMGLK